eukprot:4890957-Amphidinium_carterae.1
MQGACTKQGKGEAEGGGEGGGEGGDEGSGGCGPKAKGRKNLQLHGNAGEMYSAQSTKSPQVAPALAVSARIL